MRMAEESVSEQSSEKTNSRGDVSCQLMREESEAGCGGSAETVTSALVPPPCFHDKMKVIGSETVSQESVKTECSSAVDTFKTEEMICRRKAGSKRTRDMEPMDHSGLERKVPRMLQRVGAKQCLSPPPLEDLKLLSCEECGTELARCLDESKVPLIINVVRSMGIEKAFELFNQTSEIQVTGGQVSFEGTYKKSPGGVFLSLVKKSATVEQKKSIFGFEKRNKSIKKKERQQRLQKKREVELKKRKEDWEARALQHLADNPDGLAPVWDEVKGEPTRVERNMHKRLPGNASTTNNTHSRKGPDQNELMEFEVGGTTSLSSSAPVEPEMLAAEEFERTSDCNLDFDLQVD